MKIWRTGRTIPINVYEDDGPTSRPICQCHTVEDAKFIVAAVNRRNEMLEALERLVDQFHAYENGWLGPGIWRNRMDLLEHLQLAEATIRKARGE